MKIPIDSGQYLNAVTLGTSSQVVFKNEGRMVDDQFNPGKKRFQIEVEIVGREDEGDYTWTMNKTSMRNIAKAYTDDSSAWVGKLANIEISDQNVRGQMRKVLTGKPVV